MRRSRPGHTRRGSVLVALLCLASPPLAPAGGGHAREHAERDVPEHNGWGIVEVDVATGRERVVVPHDPCGRHFFWLPTLGPDGDLLMYIHIDVWGEEDRRPWTDLWVVDRGGRHPQKVPGSDWFYFFDWGHPARGRSPR